MIFHFSFVARLLRLARYLFLSLLWNHHGSPWGRLDWERPSSIWMTSATSSCLRVKEVGYSMQCRALSTLRPRLLGEISCLLPVPQQNDVVCHLPFDRCQCQPRQQKQGNFLVPALQPQRQRLVAKCKLVANLWQKASRHRSFGDWNQNGGQATPYLNPLWWPVFERGFHAERKKPAHWCGYVGIFFDRSLSFSRERLSEWFFWQWRSVIHFHILHPHIFTSSHPRIFTFSFSLYLPLSLSLLFVFYPFLSFSL